MKTKRLIALALSILMLFALAACGPAASQPTPTPAAPTPTPAPAPTPEPTPAPAVNKGPASVDFEDGNIGFVAAYSGMANADASTLELGEFDGSKALKVVNGSGKVPYIAIDAASLLGDNISKVASISMNLGIENPSKFAACSGNLIPWATNKLGSNKMGWSVYMASKNPKEAVFEVGGLSAAETPVVVLTLDTDTGADKQGNATLYIDDIRFLDASGSVIAADTSASFAEPDGFGGSRDMSNLKYLKDTVALEGMSGISGDAWGQNGVEMTEEFLAALVPGSVVEIEYSSDSGDIWIVMPWAAAGWSRVQQQTAATNNSHNIAQITYEQIAAVCGDDITAWGAMFQCEASGSWEVYGVSVGQDSGLVNTAGKVSIDGMSGVTGDAWGQNGVELTEEQIALLKPGAVIEVSYASESGDLWLVFPWAAAGWSRIEQQTAACNGSVMQITYEQIAAVCGDDVSTWGTMLQCEASGAWEVYGASICTSKFVNTKDNVEIPGFAVTGDAWGQNGIELNEEQIALLKPGAVITIQYTSESGELWLVMPWAAAGWSRIQQQNAACDGNVCQITYEQIAEVCGDDVSTWGAMMQCEASSAWEVYSLSIGQAS